MGRGSASRFWDKKGGSAVLTALIMSTSLIAIGVIQAGPVSAQETTATNFSVPAGPLDQALATFGRQAGLQVTYAPSVGAGKKSPGVSGRLSSSQALSRILKASGLSFSFVNSATVAISAGTAAGEAGADSAIVLAPIDIKGSSESAWGPVNGLVATRSASGTKTDTPLVETPQSISVVSAKQIQDQAVRNVGQALRYSPGVVAEEYGGTDSRIDRFMVRGFANSYPYLDGLTTNTYYTLLSPKIEPYGLERVEVVSGPSSSLYGAGDPGGLVAAVSKRPTDTPLHELQWQFGSPKGVSGAFDFSGPVTKDGSLLYRLTSIARAADTQVDHVDTKNYYIAPAFTWKPDEDTTFTLLSKFQRSDDGYLGQNLPALGTLYSASFGKIPTDLFIGEPDFNDITRSSRSVGYAFEHRFNDVWTVRQNMRYSYTDTNIQQIGTSGFIPGTTELDRWTLGANANLHDFGVDTQAEAKFDTGPFDHTLLFGIDYTSSHSHWYESDGTASPLDVLNPIYGQPFTVPAIDFATDDRLRQTGIYAEDQISFDKWRISGGLRYDWATTSDTDLVTADNPTVKNDDQKLTGRIGVLYLFDNGIAPYVSYSTSFKPTPGLNSTTGDALKPTTGRQYEIGVKYQPDGYNSYMTVAAYNIDQNDVTSTNPGPPVTYTQTGAVRMRGVELSSVADLDNGFKLIANYTYNDGEITKDGDPSLLGNRPKDVPRNMASLWLDKTIETGVAEGLGFGAGARYVGSRYGDNANTLKIPDYFLVDASVHYDYKDWRFALNATNLFDKKYVGTCDSDTTCYYGERRTVLGTVSVKW
ncbi:MAG: TonB-dependent siderophore receptor [Rhizobium sp.]|nr:MAG: TonB-dependent siderophore receptor [Rhizobium sp.]